MTIVLTGGGTAGHCLPCIALLPELKKYFSHIVYIGGIDSIEEEIAVKNNLAYYGITTVKLRRSLTPKNFAIPFKLWKGIKEAKAILKHIKPDVIFSKGGFVALPVVWAGSSQKIPIISHESDLTLGLANRLVVRRSRVLCTTFPQTAAKYKNAIHTGAIIRPELSSGERTKIDGFTRNKPNLLVMGGSQGATAINNAVWNAAHELLLHYNVLHITGRGKSNPKIKKNNYLQYEYLSAPQNAFAWADVVVSRAGAGALCELLSLRKPTVFIPLPKTESRGDQIDNANFMLESGCCSVLWQEDLTTENLLKVLEKTLRNRQQIVTNCEKLDWLDGTQKVIKVIWECIKK
ncbi:MAG: UDP-N-acetylglucosamine--N-acetylmuramyl-(pentapeptide) pyrophosphoryl-undecaprenol N-acetylglucosamine transferase [Christensenellaceae bacterium]|jgi:UDP-N-acetylglucosamine--N-acetylmuramyl-(pentapeptide) pyrophosphoryl-undecaprenol N-acetylglucosamine transferase|nr:UDP-N-acetylglucosamine--N-acetylmuramyl-(pentapeptide) pyrophosphoryl-undecaprenol N-acetylglucosamine transferase [Christensenellaceae bacterium]